MSTIVSHSEFRMELPEYAATALQALEDAGFEAWCVGGCVRDALLSRSINDYDIASNARWDETETALTQSGFTVHRTGTKHGTVTASLDGHAMEITTYRADGIYSDGRHPDDVRFVSNIQEYTRIANGLLLTQAAYIHCAPCQVITPRRSAYSLIHLRTPVPAIDDNRIVPVAVAAIPLVSQHLQPSA